MPPAASRDDSIGALSFAGYFVKALDWSLATTDPYLLEQFSAPTCGPCYTYINGLNSLRAKGGYLTGGRATLSGISLGHGSLVPAKFVVQVTFSQTPEVILSQSGSNPTTVSPPSNPAVNWLYLGWVTNGWQLEEIGGPR